MDNNYQKLLTEILICLRAGRARSLINRRLKLPLNQVNRYESGRKKMTWSEFQKFCEVCGADLGPFFKKYELKVSARKDSTILLAWLTGDVTIGLAANFAEVSRFVMADWRSGKRAPNMDQILLMLDKKGVLYDFLNSFCDISALPEVADRFRLEKARAEYLKAHPICYLIIQFLGLSSYHDQKSHRHGVIAELTGISLEEEKTYLRELEKLEVLEWKNGKWLNKIISKELKDTAEFFRYFSGVAHLNNDAIVAGKLRGMTVTQLLCVSKESLPLVRDALRDLNSRLTSIALNTQEENNEVLLVDFQVMSLLQTSVKYPNAP